MVDTVQITVGSLTIDRLENSDLTTMVVGGTGTFDVIMQGFKSQLELEFNANRITGADYAKAYVALVQAAITSATQFLVAREQAYWSAVTSQLQAGLIAEQTETARAQTLDTRSDGTVVSGVLGSQKALYAQQIDSYKRDAEVKASKLFTDAWITMKTIDEGLDPPNGFTNANLDQLLNTLIINNALGNGEIPA